jgi:hypothetical protein
MTISTSSFPKALISGKVKKPAKLTQPPKPKKLGGKKCP